MGIFSTAKAAISSVASKASVGKPTTTASSTSSAVQAAASLGAKATSAPSVSSVTSSAVQSVSTAAPTSRTSSGGGGGSKPIVSSTTRQVTGYDSGNQSIVASTGTGYNPATGVNEGSMTSQSPTNPYKLGGNVSSTSSQLTGSPQPNTISAGGTLSSMAGTQKFSFGQAAIQSAKDIGTNIKYGFTGKGEYYNPFWSFGATGKEKSELVAYNKPNFGTIQTTGLNVDTGELIQTGYTTPVTFKDIQVKTEQYNLFNPQTPKPDVQGFTTRTGQGLVTGIPAAIETGALIGASTLGGPVGLAVSSAYTLGSGFKQTVESPTLTGKALGVGTVGLSLVGIKASSFNIEKSIVQGEFNSLSYAPVKYNQFQLQQGDNSLVKFTAVQKQGGLTRTTSGYGVAFKEGENTFVLPKGNVNIKTSGETSWNIFGPSKTNIISVEQGTFGVKGTSISKDELAFTASKSTYIPKASMSTIYGLDTSSNTIGKFTTNVKLGGKEATSFAFTSSKNINPDELGRQRFFSVGTGVKNMRAVKPLQMGVTTIVEDTGNINLGGKGLASPFEDITFGGGKSSTRNVLKDLYGKPMVTEVQSVTPKSVGSPMQVDTTAFGSTQNLFSTKTIPQFNLGSSKEQLQSKVELKPSQISAVVPLETTATKQEQKPVVITKLISETITTPKQRTGSVQLVTPVEVFEQKQQQVGIISTPAPVNNIPLNIPMDFGIPIVGFKFPSFDIGQTSTRSFKGKRKLGYTPDFKSIFFGIKGKAPKKSVIGGYGEVARPIIGTPKKQTFLKKLDNRITSNVKLKAKSFLKKRFK